MERPRCCFRDESKYKIIKALSRPLFENISVIFVIEKHKKPAVMLL